MARPTPHPRQSQSIHWSITVTAVSVLLLIGGGLIWLDQDPPQPRLVDPGPGPQPTELLAMAATLDDLPPRFPAAMPVHSIIMGEENGTKVVKIKVAAEGDELIVDAATGRLLETRPYRPMTAPSPMGKFAAPFAPMT